MADKPENASEDKRSISAVAFNYAIVVLMMLCIGITAVQAGRYFSPGWNGSYLPVLIFMVALEALISRRFSSRAEGAFGWIAFRAVELVVLLIFIKIVLYVVYGSQLFMQDFASLQHNSLRGLFTGEYLVVTTLSLIVWFLSGLFAGRLIDLEEDRELLEQERLGYFNRDRESSRRELISLIFSVGGLMLLLVSIMSMRFPFLPDIGFRPNIILLLAYFLLGFVLLAQSQLSLLKAHWYIQDIPISPVIARRWAPYSIALLAGIAFIVLLLPTQYSLGFLALVEWVVSIILALFAILQLILFAPIIAFLNFLASLLGKAPIQVQQAPPTPLPTVVPPGPAGTLPHWIEILKSVTFWGIFLFVIIYAFRQYILQRKDLFEAVKNFPLINWFSRMWHSLLSGMHQANLRTSEIISAGLRRLTSRRKLPASPFNLLNAISTRLPPRQRILLTYFQMIQWNAHNGIRRLNTHTPYEYARMLVDVVPSALPDVDAITKIFMEARYTRHEITPGMADTAQTAWQNIQGLIRLDLDKKEGQA